MRKGTTLIELLMALSSISIMMLLFLPIASQMVNSTSSTVDTLNINSIEMALKQYVLDHNELPIGVRITEEQLSSENIEFLSEKLKDIYEFEQNDLIKATDDILDSLHTINIEEIEEYLHDPSFLEDLILIGDESPFLAGCVLSMNKIDTERKVDELLILLEDECFSGN